MIKLEYQRMLLLLREEEQLHLEALEQEAKEICEELKESVFRMSQYRESLKEMYKELTEMCHKPDMELLQVRKEDPSSERETLFQTSAVTLKYYLSRQMITQSARFCDQGKVNFLGVNLSISTDQIRSVTQSCPNLCDSMNHSTPSLPVHYHLPEFTETHVHPVSDAIQPSHPLSSPSPPVPNPSQHQSLFQ